MATSIETVRQAFQDLEVRIMHAVNVASGELGKPTVRDVEICDKMFKEWRKLGVECGDLSEEEAENNCVKQDALIVEWTAEAKKKR